MWRACPHNILLLNVLVEIEGVVVAEFTPYTVPVSGLIYQTEGRRRWRWGGGGAAMLSLLFCVHEKHYEAENPSSGAAANNGDHPPRCANSSVATNRAGSNRPQLSVNSREKLPRVAVVSVCLFKDGRYNRFFKQFKKKKWCSEEKVTQPHNGGGGGGGVSFVPKLWARVPEQQLGQWLRNTSTCLTDPQLPAAR